MKHFTVKDLFMMCADDPTYMIAHAAITDADNWEDAVAWLRKYCAIYKELMNIEKIEDTQMAILAEPDARGLDISSFYYEEDKPVRYGLEVMNHEEFLGLSIPNALLERYSLPYLSSELLRDRGWYGAKSADFDIKLFNSCYKKLIKLEKSKTTADEDWFLNYCAKEFRR